MSDNDSEEEGAPGCEPRQDSGHMKRTKAAPRKRIPPRGEFVNAKIRGMSFCFTVMAGPRVCVPIEGPWLENMIQDLLSRRDEKNKYKSADVSDTGGPKSLLTEKDKGRIAWKSSTTTTAAAWGIHFVNKHGVEKWARAGLSVPSTSLTGEEIDEDTFLENARQVLIKARKEWDRADHSGADRFGDAVEPHAQIME